MSTTRPISAGFPFRSHFVEVHASKLHYIDEGSGDPILFLHGNPTSSYLWRNIIPYLTSLGRCVVPDLIGMGKSDKPDLEYRFVDHSTYVEGFIKKLGLEKITFVVHDWGSALGFHYAMRHEKNVKALAFMEAILAPVPSWDMFPEDFKAVFTGFRTPDVGWDMIVSQNMFVEKKYSRAPLSENLPPKRWIVIGNRFSILLPESRFGVGPMKSLSPESRPTWWNS